MEESVKKEHPILRKRKVILEPAPFQAVKDLTFPPKFKWVGKLPDLTITAYVAEYVVDADPPVYRITITVKNIGGRRSGPSRVYVNAISLIPHPGLNDIRLQSGPTLPELKRNETHDCIVSFPLHEMHAKEVGKIEVFVDPKSEVFECREDNNYESWLWPT